MQSNTSLLQKNNGIKVLIIHRKEVKKIKLILTLIVITTFLIINSSSSSAAHLQTVEATAYEWNLYEGKGITKYGERCIPYCTVAIDPNYIKPYSVIAFDYAGYRFFTIATDTGSAIKGYKIDFAMETTGQCIAFGRRQLQCTIYEPGEYDGLLGWIKL